MIKLFRVDDRLLHGQIAFSWIKNLKIQTILIADDYIANDEFMKMTLGLSKPNFVELMILEVDEEIEFLKQKENHDIHILIIVKSVENAYRMINRLNNIHSINIGYLREKVNTKEIVENVFMSEKEIVLCKEIEDKNVEVEIRMRYEDEKKQFHTLNL